MIIRARSIVATRNDLRSSLEEIGEGLDSQIDELQKELAKPRPDPDKIGMTIEVLRQKWPSKRSQIEIAVRKILAELGLERIQATQKAGE